MLSRSNDKSMRKMDDKIAVRNGLIVRLEKAKDFLEGEKDDETVRFSVRLNDIETIVDALLLENQLCKMWKERHEFYQE